MEYINSSNIYKMEKVAWKQVRHNDRNGNLPNLRWGHSCCIIDEDVLFFGGYADSTYMNDLWAFNTITMEWREIHSKGKIPSFRSNCAMNYDKQNNRVVLFGGGGANKRRFNTIHILDWVSKEWSEIKTNDSESTPWERTYHTAQLFYPYLVVYGGQGVSDLDDLWIFDFDKIKWTEVPIPKTAVRPCARRFHSSAQVGNQFFVIAGCYNKYRCLSDIYSIDLTYFFETGKTDQLEWRERKMKDSTFLTRWGHTSITYDNKIYVFGGRFCNDLNDVLLLDPQKDQITTLKVSGDVPKARRRHSACFLGSNMLIFGGFNGEYFNDLHYINVHNAKYKIKPKPTLTFEQINRLVNVKGIKVTEIKSKQGTPVTVFPELLQKRFMQWDGLEEFSKDINQTLPLDQLKALLLNLYRGYGEISWNLREKYGIQLYESRGEMELEFKQQITQQSRGFIGSKKQRYKHIEPIILLEDDEYSQFLKDCREHQQGSLKFNVNNETLFRSSRAKIALQSEYFYNVLTGTFQEQFENLYIPFEGSLLFQTVLHYLNTGFVVVYHRVDALFWTKLAEIAQYYALQHLLEICEHQLAGHVDQQNCQELLIRSIDLNLSQLSVACAEKIIKTMVSRELEEQNDIFPEVESVFIAYEREKVLKDVYALLRFDILQKKIDQEYQDAKNSAKTIESEGDREEKENYEMGN